MSGGAPLGPAREPVEPLAAVGPPHAHSLLPSIGTVSRTVPSPLTGWCPAPPEMSVGTPSLNHLGSRPPGLGRLGLGIAVHGEGPPEGRAVQELLPARSSPGVLADRRGPPAGRKSPGSSRPRPVSLPDLDQNKVHVVATDYDNYLILCMENTDVPGQGLGCQYLGRCPDPRAVLAVLGGQAGGTGAAGLRGQRHPGTEGAGLGGCWDCGWL